MVCYAHERRGAIFEETDWRRQQEIEENVRALDVALTPDVLARIEEIMQGAAGQVETLPT